MFKCNTIGHHFTFYMAYICIYWHEETPVVVRSDVEAGMHLSLPAAAASL